LRPSSFADAVIPTLIATDPYSGTLAGFGCLANYVRAAGEPEIAAAQAAVLAYCVEK
jgi:hypothetical protein